ncbi:MAG: 23S rRNA (adenine(2503)-C(2))-methyltransferase RlmN [Verrucomicrobia bacterium]|nr:MAG: 23S rRNA (adenine(2503)-C(2))-methyltransferase RlmN [Verrucomicrobiota bacterium]
MGNSRIFKSLNAADLASWMAERGEKQFRVRQVLDWIYAKRCSSFAEMSNIPPELRTALADAFLIPVLSNIRCLGSADTTRKFLFQLRDGQLIESVLMPASPALYGDRSARVTACLSSQVGCAYGCKFCASGLNGWKRNLEAGEIVDQLMLLEQVSSQRVHNVVFMGMGEPFANFSNLMKAIEILNAAWGMGVGARHMTVSTSGLVPQIRQFAESPFQVRLAISLHAASDSVRDKIMPINRRYPLADLLNALDYCRLRKKQRITFEYILIKGVNDGLDQAALLVNHARRLGAKVNLIPYNTVYGLPWQRPTAYEQKMFFRCLEDGGIPVTLRKEKGHDIAAACGQLRLQQAS